MSGPLTTMIARGARKRCPVCGEGELFTRWTLLVDACSVCGTPLARREGDTYFLTYGTMALVTGVFLVTAIILLLNQGFYQRWKFLLWPVLAVGLYVSILLTARQRKGLAVAVDCYLEGLRPRVVVNEQSRN